jgi:hypothetical protein
LLQWLPQVTGDDARIFLDEESLDRGGTWPVELKTALCRTKVLVPVLGATYFRRPWCLAEWESMRAREQRLGMRTPQNPRGLIYPVVFFDSEALPLDAQAITRCDLRQWSYVTPGFSRSAKYSGFIREMQRVAEELAVRLGDAPPWQPDWPVVEPPPPSEPVMDLPRFG